MYLPATICNSVVFPAPFAPMSRQRLPRGRFRLHPLMKGSQPGYANVVELSTTASFPLVDGALSTATVISTKFDDSLLLDVANLDRWRSAGVGHCRGQDAACACVCVVPRIAIVAYSVVMRGETSNCCAFMLTWCCATIFVVSL